MTATPNTAALQSLRKMIYEMRDAQAKLRPVRLEYEARKRANMRQDGPTGFVMLRLSDAIAAPVTPANEGGV